MNASAFRHFYNYHFAENRAMWDRYVTQLSAEQFTQPVSYSHGSVRDQIVHIISADDIWFCELRGVEPSRPLPPANTDDRDHIRAHWDRVEQNMRAYLAELRDDMLFDTPIEEPDDDRDLIVWQVLLHVANHGTDHRAQILRVLNDLGVQTTSQDYIFYVYDHIMPASEGVAVKKSALLNGLQEEYQQWQALLENIGPERMDRPGVTDHWSIKDIVAHLTGWRRRTVARLQAVQRGEPEPPPLWPSHLQTDDDINAWIYESNRERSVSEVLDESHQVFQQLLAAVAGLPDEILNDPASHLPWLEGQPFTASEFFAHFHEEHEPEMRAWLAQVENQ